MSVDKTTGLTEAILLSLLPNVLAKRGTVTAGSDIDNYTESGYYIMDLRTTETLANFPSEHPKNGLLIVLNHICRVQIVIPGYSEAPIIFRTNWYDTGYRPWFKIATSKVVTTT